MTATHDNWPCRYYYRHHNVNRESTRIRPISTTNLKKRKGLRASGATIAAVGSKVSSEQRRARDARQRGMFFLNFFFSLFFSTLLIRIAQLPRSQHSKTTSKRQRLLEPGTPVGKLFFFFSSTYFYF